MSNQENHESVAYEHFRAEMFKDLKPEGEHEEELAQTIVEAIWSYQRAMAVENDLLASHMQKHAGSIQTGNDWRTPRALRQTGQTRSLRRTDRRPAHPSTQGTRPPPNPAQAKS